MSAADDIEAIAESHRRYVARLHAETEERRQTESDQSKELAAALQRAADKAEEQARADADAREAIARSLAARKANQTVMPIDDEDEESAYYRRKSWLI